MNIGCDAWYSVDSGSNLLQDEHFMVQCEVGQLNLGKLFGLCF